MVVGLGCLYIGGTGLNSCPWQGKYISILLTQISTELEYHPRSSPIISGSKKVSFDYLPSTNKAYFRFIPGEGWKGKGDGRVDVN